jgi:uncharacterized protein (DUF983 family)
VPLLRGALSAACPACGKPGCLFSGLFTVTKQCHACQFDLSTHDAGDGPVFFAMSISGIVVTVLAVWIELAFSPSMWVHIIVWPVIIIVFSVGVLRIATAMLIYLQYRHNIAGFRNKEK